MSKKIVACNIESVRWKNEVHVTYDDGSSEMIFRYYPDEISFTESELIGLTRDAAQTLHEQRDKDYIRRS